MAIRTKYFCVKCTKRVEKPIEHRKPRSAQGSDDVANIQPMCVPCHNWKHAHPAEAHTLGYWIGRTEPERDWRVDFPHAIQPNPVL